MRLAIVCSTFLSAMVSSALASPLIPFDPHALFATGGDATPITTAGIDITLSPTGGGIFVFNNATGADLPQLDVNIQFPTPLFPDGFGVTGTIFVPPGSGQEASFQASLFQMRTCAGEPSDTSSCVKMEFALIPGPLILNGQNFVLDLDKPGPHGYTGVDALVATGKYTGGTDTSSARTGEWPDSAMGGVTPQTGVPEPGTFGALLLGGSGLAIYYRRRRNNSVR
jgi:hypothetical protein